MNPQPHEVAGPHSGMPVLIAGEALDQAQAAMILVHGRGATAADILSLTAELPQQGFAFLAPQAADNAWYPQRFMQPIESNEPWLSSALQVLDAVLGQVAEAGITAEKTVLLGFSQGACLVTEYAARNARRYGGVVGLSGGLIGPEGTPRDYAGSLGGTPVFVGCSDRDPHIPESRVRETAEVMERLGGQVTMRIYPGMGHTVNYDEIEAVRAMMAALVGTGEG